MDRHKIWRLVRSNYEGLREAAPDGYEPVVEVFLLGREAPVRLGLVQTSQEEDFPWTFMADVSSEGPLKDEGIVFVPEQYVQRIEIRFAPADERPIGFSHGDLDESA